MQSIIAIMIVAAAAGQPNRDRHPDAVEVFHAGFESADDANYDAWPDNWTRQSGPGYPRYLPVKIVASGAPEGSNYLRLELNGAAAAAFSPPIPVSHLFSYVLEAYLRTEQLRGSRASISLTFFDANSKSLGVLRSEKYATLENWTKISVSPLVAPNQRVTHATIGVHIEPSEGVAPDLVGAACFDDLWLGRLPRMSLSLKEGSHLFTESEPVEVECQVSGVFDPDPLMNFVLVDVSGRRVDSLERRLEARTVNQGLATKSALTGETAAQVSGFVGSTSWKPTVNEAGFYRISVTMAGRGGKILERQASIVVLPTAKRPRSGEFGWTLDGRDKALPLSSLVQILPEMGVHWVKYPVWVSEKDTGRPEELSTFAERLSARGIETVGLLCDPPAEVRTQLGDGAALHAAEVFAAKPELWYPSLEPVMTQLSLQTRWWQLGMDDDASFVGYPDLVRTIASVKQQIQRFGQEVHLGIGWRTINQPLADESPPWEFLALADDPPLNPDELAAYLPPLAARNVKRWVTIEPLSRSQYTTEARAADLIHRLIAAKVHGAEAIYLLRPFNTDRGLMNDDGTPGELLLPWRTTALALSGAQYVGSISLAGGSQNRVFVRDNEMVMVAWNQQPVSERAYIGENVKQVDVWGRTVTPPREKNEHVLSFGPMPTFITGVEPAVARMNMSVAFEQTRIPSEFGTPHETTCIVRNYFSQGVGGQLRLITPEGWKVYPRVAEFKLAAGEEMRVPLSIVLPFDAGGGRQSVRVDLEVNAERRYEFSAHRHFDVGLGDVTLDAVTRLNERGELEVEQRVENHTESPVSFKCLLFVPDRRRMVNQVVKLGQDRDVKTYRLPDGRELIGKTLWLRAEEVGGKRTLNHRFVAAE